VLLRHRSKILSEFPWKPKYSSEAGLGIENCLGDGDQRGEAEFVVDYRRSMEAFAINAGDALQKTEADNLKVAPTKDNSRRETVGCCF
jgi:hypothetical protein